MPPLLPAALSVSVQTAAWIVILATVLLALACLVETARRRMRPLLRTIRDAVGASSQDTSLAPLEDHACAADAFRNARLKTEYELALIEELDVEGCAYKSKKDCLDVQIWASDARFQSVRLQADRALAPILALEDAYQTPNTLPLRIPDGFELDFRQRNGQSELCLVARVPPEFKPSDVVGLVKRLAQSALAVRKEQGLR